MKTRNLVWIFAMALVVIPASFADLDPNRVVGQAKLNGAWAPAGTLINITAGGVTVQVAVDDGINVVPAEFGYGRFKTDPDVPYWDTGDYYIVKSALSNYLGQLTGNLVGGTTDVGVLELISELIGPLYVDIELNADNQSVNLNWSTVVNAQYYNVYFSDNLTKIENLNLSAIPAGVGNVSGIYSTKWNDTNISGIKKRYYRVAAINGDINLLSVNAVAKYVHELVASNNGILGRNLIAEPINSKLNAKTYLNAIATIYNPSITKLDRTDPNKEDWVSQVVGLPVSLFNLTQEEGYMTFVNKTQNYTFVGWVWTNLTTNKLIANSNGVLGRNLVGVTYTRTGYNAKKYVDGLSATLNPSLTRLDRTDPNKEDWVSQVVGLPASLFTITEGEGYMAFVNQSYNYTLS